MNDALENGSQLARDLALARELGSITALLTTLRTDFADFRNAHGGKVEDLDRRVQVLEQYKASGEKPRTADAIAGDIAGRLVSLEAYRQAGEKPRLGDQFSGKVIWIVLGAVVAAVVKLLFGAGMIP